MGLLSPPDAGRTLGDVATGIAAAGTTQATATTLPADHCTVTTATQGSADGVVMKAGNMNDVRTVANHTSGNIVVYPPSGAALNGAAANTGLTLPANKAALFFFLTSLIISVVTTA